MTMLYPYFYPRFHCKAGACRHSCCVSEWDIDIDDITVDMYLTMHGSLGEELRRSIACKDGQYSFRMKKGGGCPFFREDGLCRIILEKGNDYLCDICTMHPRFFVRAGNFELSGIGLACEKSVELLLADTGPLYFLESAGKKWTLPAIFHALGEEISGENLRFTPRIDRSYYGALLSRFKKTDPIDKAWTTRLACLEKRLSLAENAVKTYEESIPVSHLQRLYEYILYRSSEKMETYGADVLLRYARESTDFILLESALCKDFPENIRRWSEQIEYDTENVDILLTLLSGKSFPDSSTASKQKKITGLPF